MGKKSKRPGRDKAKPAKSQNGEPDAADYNYYGMSKQEWDGAAVLRYQINKCINSSVPPVQFLWDLWRPDTELGSAMGVKMGGQFFAANIDERFLGQLVASAVHIYRTFPSGATLEEGRRIYTRYIVQIILHAEAYLQVGRDTFFDGFEMDKVAQLGKPQWRKDLIDDKAEKLKTIDELVQFLAPRSTCSILKQEAANKAQED